MKKCVLHPYRKENILEFLEKENPEFKQKSTSVDVPISVGDTCFVIFYGDETPFIIQAKADEILVSLDGKKAIIRIIPSRVLLSHDDIGLNEAGLLLSARNNSAPILGDRAFLTLKEAEKRIEEMLYDER